MDAIEPHWRKLLPFVLDSASQFKPIPPAPYYRSEYVRPETAIRALKDPKWFPLLQTPPFPEYTSGHSVVSSASAVVLTHLYGDSFAYVDSVEVNYGLPPRSFPSFSAAAAEASRSRLYGGIHFLPAIENGVKQGQAIGNYLIQQLNLKR